MDCQGIRETLYEYHKGWCGPQEARAVEAHLAGCPDCQAEARSAQSCLSLLHALPEVDPAPEIWKKISSQLTPRRAAAFRYRFPAAAAAGLLIVLATVAILAAGSRSRALPVVLETRKALTLNESFQAGQFSSLAIPDVGTLKVNRGATLRFLGPRTVLLESGEVFAEILPSGSGFEVRTGETAAFVRGTRFGVRAPSTVYVMEGRVEVRSGGGRLDLGPNQVAVGAAFASVSAEDHVRWLAEHERPAVRLVLDPRDQTTVTPGAPLRWALILETDALAPLYLPDLRDASQFLALDIDGHSASLDPTRAELRAVRASNGMVRLDVSHRCVIECAVDPALFRGKGRAVVRAVYTSGQNAPEKAWVGIVRSDPVTVEVR
jgi:ferric-dicitrate binding protein FerR (iron transport regulator)